MELFDQITGVYCDHSWKLSHPTLAVVAMNPTQGGLYLGALVESFERRLGIPARWDSLAQQTLVQLAPLTSLSIQALTAQVFAKAWTKLNGVVVDLEAYAGMKTVVDLAASDDDQGTWEPRIWAVAR